MSFSENVQSTFFIKKKRGEFITAEFRRAVSAAASVAPSGGERLAVRRTVTLPPSPFRSRLCSGVQGDGPSSSMSPEEMVDKMLQQVKEFDAQYEQDLTEVLKKYNDALHTEELGSFERVLSFCGVRKTKFRHNFARCCDLATLFGLSTVVGLGLADQILG